MKKIWDIADLSIPTGNLHSNIAKVPRKVGHLLVQETLTIQS